MMDAAPTKNRPALAERTNDEPELDGDDKRRRASIEGQLAEDVSPSPRAKRVKTPVNYVGKEEDADKACGVEEAPESSEYAEQEDAWEKGSESEEEEDVASEEEDIWYDSSKNKPPRFKPIILTAPKEMDEPWNNLTDKEETAVLRAICDSNGSDSHKIIRSRAEVLLSVPCGSLKAKTPALLGLMQVWTEMGLDREERRKAEMSAPKEPARCMEVLTPQTTCKACLDEARLLPGTSTKEPHTCYRKQDNNNGHLPVRRCMPIRFAPYWAWCEKTEFMKKKDAPKDLDRTDKRGYDLLPTKQAHFQKHRVYKTKDAKGEDVYYAHKGRF